MQTTTICQVIPSNKNIYLKINYTTTNSSTISLYNSTEVSGYTLTRIA